MLNTVELGQLRLIARRMAEELPDNGFDRCRVMSGRLQRRLTMLTFNCTLIRAQGLKTLAENADARWMQLPQSSWTHYVVLVEGYVIDITAGQFFPDRETPYIVPHDEFVEEWETVGTV